MLPWSDVVLAEGDHEHSKVAVSQGIPGPCSVPPGCRDAWREAGAGPLLLQAPAPLHGHLSRLMALSLA